MILLKKYIYKPRYSECFSLYFHLIPANGMLTNVPQSQIGN